jgi:hypothetical protein
MEPGADTVSEILCEIEEGITELPLRMTVRALRMLCESCKAEMFLVGEEGACMLFLKLVCEMQKILQALSLANTGSNAGRLCSSISRGMCVVDTDASMSRSSAGDEVGVIEDILAMYEALSAELVALAMDDDFIGCMGPTGRKGLLGITSVFRTVIECGEQIASGLRA